MPCFVNLRLLGEPPSEWLGISLVNSLGRLFSSPGGLFSKPNRALSRQRRRQKEAGQIGSTVQCGLKGHENMEIDAVARRGDHSL